MELISSARLDSGPHQESIQKLADYEDRLYNFSSIALNLDSYLDMVNTDSDSNNPGEKLEKTDMNHNLGKLSADLLNCSVDRREGGRGDQDRVEDISTQAVTSRDEEETTAQSPARPGQSRLSTVSEEEENQEKTDLMEEEVLQKTDLLEEENQEKTDLIEEEDSEAESSIPSLSPPHMSDESQDSIGDDYNKLFIVRNEKVEDVGDKLCETGLTERVVKVEDAVKKHSRYVPG